MNNAKKYLALSQVSLLGLLIICCFIKPSVVVHNGGVSNFGNAASTIVLYILAFALSSVFLGLAARAILQTNHQARLHAALLLLLSLLEIIVLVSTFPRHLSRTYSTIHDDAGIVFFSYELILSAWLVTKLGNRRITAFMCFGVFGSVVALLSILKVIHFLFIGQMAAALGYGFIIVTCFPVSDGTHQPNHLLTKD